MKINDVFTQLSKRVSDLMGSPTAFVLVLFSTLIWLSLGPHYSFSSDYQMPYNTLSSVLTLLIAFLIANNQNRDAKALHLKLDELLVLQKDVCKEVVSIEEISDDELSALQKNSCKEITSVEEISEDELLLILKKSCKEFIDIEDATDEELKNREEEFRRIREQLK